MAQKFPDQKFVFKKLLQAEVLYIESPQLVSLLQHLQQNKWFDFLMCVSGAHYPDQTKPFEVSYELFSSKTLSRLRVKIQLSETGQIPTAQFVYPTADWFEREIYDMYGIKFTNHPNMKRILTHHQFKGHPLRKDYPADKQQHLTQSLPFCMDNEPDGSPPKDEGFNLTPLNIGPSHPAHSRNIKGYGFNEWGKNPPRQCGNRLSPPLF